MVKLLDCTLRDGGYVNDWKFTDQQVSDVTLHVRMLDLTIWKLDLETEELNQIFVDMDLPFSAQRSFLIKSLPKKDVN